MANLILRHLAKLSKIQQMWHLPIVCSKFAIEVNPFFRPVRYLRIYISLLEISSNLLRGISVHIRSKDSLTSNAVYNLRLLLEIYFKLYLWFLFAFTLG